MAQDYLDLIGGQKASRTSMDSMAEAHVLWARGDKLALGFFAGLLAHVVKAIAVPPLVIWIVFSVPHPLHRGKCKSAFRYHEPVR